MRLWVCGFRGLIGVLGVGFQGFGALGFEFGVLGFSGFWVGFLVSRVCVLGFGVWVQGVGFAVFPCFRNSAFRVLVILYLSLSLFLSLSLSLSVSLSCTLSWCLVFDLGVGEGGGHLQKWSLVDKGDIRKILSLALPGVEQRSGGGKSL